MVVGRTGSGKTRFAVWLLGTQDIHNRPWVIIDYKNDDLVNQIERSVILTFDEPLPKRAGVYILKVLPGETDALTAWLWRVYQRGDIGIYVDEGSMIGQRNDAFDACLTQGRSKNIPMIILTQRPVLLSGYVFSEATFYFVFDLILKKDREKIMDNIPIDMRKSLPDYHSFYFDVPRKRKEIFGAVPDDETLLATIDAKIPVSRRTL